MINQFLLIFQYFDMDIINQEFSCNRETLVLPKMYGTLDSEYQKHNSPLSSRMSMCKNFSEVQYFHFTGLGKPWTSADKMSNYLSRFESEAADLIKRWFNHAHTSCPWLVPHHPLWSTSKKTSLQEKNFPVQGPVWKIV